MSKVSKEVLNELDQKAPLMDIGDSYRVFFDLSSTCSGYCVAKMVGQKCTISRVGAIWFGDDWKHGQKYQYMQSLVSEDLYVVNAITDIIYEKYSIDVNQMNNCLVVPEMIGAIKAAAHDVSSEPLGVEDIAPTQWRKILGIVADVTPRLNKQGLPELTSRGKPKYNKEWKQPAIRFIDKAFPDKVPKKITSNVTGNMRGTPHDLYEAMCICMAWHKKFGVKEFVIADGAFDGGAELD